MRFSNTVTAVQYDGSNAAEVVEFLGDVEGLNWTVDSEGGGTAVIHGFLVGEGLMRILTLQTSEWLVIKLAQANFNLQTIRSGSGPWTDQDFQAVFVQVPEPDEGR